MVTAAQLMTGIAAVVLAPVIGGAIALGVVGPQAFASRTGRMQAFNHAGNVVGSTVYGLAGYLISLRAGFWIASVCGIFVVIATLMIKGTLIDDKLARGLTPGTAWRGSTLGLGGAVAESAPADVGVGDDVVAACQRRDAAHHRTEARAGQCP